MPAQHDDRRDRELFARLAGGDAGALGEVYDRRGPALFRHALALTRNRADAEDLVQSAFVKLASASTRLLGVRRPASYLHRMIHAAWIDVTRRRMMAGEGPMPDDLAVAAGGDLGEALDVRRALSALPEPQREAVVLHVFEGFSFREIGGITGVSTFTAASRYRLAVDRLRQILGQP